MVILSRIFLPGALFVLLASSATAAKLAPYDSTFTKHDYAACGETKSPEPGVVEVHTCKGAADIPVTWTSEPDSSEVAVGQIPRNEDLDLGDAFFEAGTTIEWRGPKKNGSIAPVAAVLRYSSGQSIGRMGRTRLVVYKLEESGASCIMAVMNGGPTANAEARKIIDGSAKSFVCGTSMQIRK